MKRMLSILVVSICLLVMSACTGASITSTASDLHVVNKGYSEDYKHAWIIAYDLYSEKQVKKKIMVENPMVWNLIEKEKTYSTSYSKEGNKPWKLDQIEHIGDKETLR
ncbi:hypothetical protein [Pontibacillus sp. HMF3514]|uniref:hypothetical protein n=1 Tax=Pontibacillus sp. HMF3514 TaxID=2692425 RepID=UPI0013204226|nr:hypothetical protein [Pontibacillus sp. HMF3514]QHE51749.1 hypothetical protein GS400_06725 [Pontibacillus sp. HMF3514]